MIATVVDWSAGRYERAAEEIEPVASVVVAQAALAHGDEVLDPACGTGNAALLAAARGARVIGVDSASRLLAVARERARAEGLEIDFREGDLLALPVRDAAADVVLSVFGVTYAGDPAAAINELGRVLRPAGRALISAWVPAGPIAAMIAALGGIVGRVTGSPTPQRFAWFDEAQVCRIASDAGLALTSMTAGELEIRDSSPDAYVAGGQELPMALAVAPVLERAGAEAEARDAMTEVLRDGNEDPGAFLIHSPYVVHELRAG